MRDRFRIYTVGVGGQGTLTAARVLGEAALAAGLNVVISEIHGMSQRGGIVETSISMGRVHSPLIGEGEADVVLGFEPLETLRALPKASHETLVIMNTRPVIPPTVKLGQSRYPHLAEILSHIEAMTCAVIALDAEQLACQAGAAIATNMVMLGALAATGKLPFPSERAREAIARLTPRHAPINLKAFELGASEVLRQQEEPDDEGDRSGSERTAATA